MGEESQAKIEYHPELDFRGIPAYFLEKMTETGLHGTDVAEVVERLICGIVEKKCGEKGGWKKGIDDKLKNLYTQLQDGDVTDEDFLRRVRGILGVADVEGESIEDFFAIYDVIWDDTELDNYTPIRQDPEPEALPLLDDNSFTKKFPGIENVAHFLEKIRNRGIDVGSFEVIGIRTMNEFLDLIKDGDRRATAVYQAVRTIFRY